jgi:hypothetical protein
MESPPHPAGMDSSKPAQTGGQAARKLYDTPELRHRVFSLLPKRTLAVLLRLEKASTASVAGVLYKTVHVSLMSKMSVGSVGHIKQS